MIETSRELLRMMRKEGANTCNILHTCREKQRDQNGPSGSFNSILTDAFVADSWIGCVSAVLAHVVAVVAFMVCVMNFGHDLDRPANLNELF